MKSMQHKAFGRHQVSVIVWDTNANEPKFFEYTIQEESDIFPWKAEWKAKLLVVIFVCLSGLEVNSERQGTKKEDR